MKKIGISLAVAFVLLSFGSAFAKMPAFKADNYPIEVLESNGKKTFDKASLETRDYIRVLHLKGSPFEMGYQHGTLLNKEITQVLKKRTKIRSYFRGGEKKRTLKYIRHAESIVPSEYLDEIKGMAAATDIDYDYMLASRLIWELRQTGCTTVAANGAATVDGNIIYLRSMENSRRIHTYLEIIVIICEPDLGNSFVSINGPGGIGVYSGMNERKITIDDNIIGYVKNGFRRDGIPLTLYRRMIIQQANNMDDAQEFIETHIPSGPNNILITDGKANEMRVYEVAGSKHAARRPENDILCSTNHPLMLNLDLVRKYEGSYERYDVATTYLKKHYGKIDSGKLIEFIKSDFMAKLYKKRAKVLQYIVVMAPKSQDFWVAVQKKDNKPASHNRFIKFNLLEEL
jgi:hypothetical protein